MQSAFFVRGDNLLTFACVLTHSDINPCGLAIYTTVCDIPSARYALRARNPQTKRKPVGATIGRPQINAQIYKTLPCFFQTK